MTIDIKVPELGESVTEATIAKWYKKPGDAVQMDELILELETEKVTLEVNATANGVLESVSKAEEEVVAVGEVIGSIKEGAVAAPAKKTESSSDAEQQLEQNNSSTTHGSNNSEGAIMAPSATKLVAENNINSNQITGTGKGGRINKADVLAALDAQKNGNVNLTMSSAGSESGFSGPREERVKMSRLRKTIAKRLKDSQNTAAILSTFNEIDMSNVIALRKRFKDSFIDKHDVKLGFMSFFVKAVVNALKEIPSINAEIDGDEIVYKNYYDIGVAVGTEQGLVVPVVKGVDNLNFAGVEKQIISLAGRAREGKLSMQELSGGTFSITNGGVYGSLLSTPIINPPQTGIIGLHSTQERPVAVNGKVEIRPMMYVALSYDHRIIDGKDAVTFLVKVKQAIEDPERLLLDL